METTIVACGDDMSGPHHVETNEIEKRWVFTDGRETNRSRWPDFGEGRTGSLASCQDGRPGGPLATRRNGRCVVRRGRPRDRDGLFRQASLAINRPVVELGQRPDSRWRQLHPRGTRRALGLRLRIRVTRSERLACDNFTFIRLASGPVDGLASELDWSPIRVEKEKAKPDREN
jgi:hypothetical protein